MSNFSALKTAIQNAIKQNGNEEITGNLLQNILLSIVETLGDSAIITLETDLDNEATTRGDADTQLNNLITGVKNNVDNGYVYAGIATPSTVPVSGKVFFFALQAGTYTNFGGTTVTEGITILKYNGTSWVKEQVLFTDGGVFDISAYHATGGTLAKYADLTAALGTSGANIPQSIRKGGMSVKFVQSSDNKYIQARCMAQAFTTDVTQWQTVDAEPTTGSENLVKSGGVYVAINDERDRAESAERELSADLQTVKAETLEENRQMVNNIMENYAPVEIIGDVTNAADEEDLTSVSVEGTDVLKFKDKVYNPLVYSGLGRKILRKNIVDGVNTLTQDMMSDANTIYVIQYDYVLGANITVPANCVLEFDGGSLNNGTIDFNGCYIQANSVPIFNNIDVPDGWILENYIKKGYCGDFDYNWMTPQSPTEQLNSITVTLQKCIDIMGFGTIRVPQDISLNTISYKNLSLARNVTIEVYDRGLQTFLSNGYSTGSVNERILKAPFHPALVVDCDLNLDNNALNEDQKHVGRSSLLFRRNGSGSFHVIDEWYLDDQSPIGQAWDGGLNIVRLIGGYRSFAHYNKNGNIRYGQLSIAQLYTPEFPHIFERSVCIENEATTSVQQLMRLKDIADNNTIKHYTATELTKEGNLFKSIDGRLYFAYNDGNCRYGQLDVPDYSKPALPHEFLGNVQIKSKGTTMLNLVSGSYYLQFRVYKDGRISVEGSPGGIAGFSSTLITFLKPISVGSGTPTFDSEIAYNTTYHKLTTLQNNVVVDLVGDPANAEKSGVFANKPSNVRVGFGYFCTDRQTSEGATDGIMIYHKGSGVWVDALGRVVS